MGFQQLINDHEIRVLVKDIDPSHLNTFMSLLRIGTNSSTTVRHKILGHSLSNSSKIYSLLLYYLLRVPHK
jgi:hypothetical protein